MALAKHSNILKKILEETLYFLLGLIVTIISLSYLIISIPIIVYRIIICYLLRPLYPSNVVKPVSLGSTGMACDLFGSRAKFSPRTNVATYMAMEGRKSKEEVMTSIEKNWFQARNDKGQLRFPELQMYFGKWMGFIFWMKDETFKLENHIFSHDIEVDSSYQDAEKFTMNLMDDLLNEPWTPKRSPWQLHIVNNYKSKELEGHTKESVMTLYIFKSHHALADGISTLTLWLEAMWKTPLKTIRPMKKSEGRPKITLGTILYGLSFPLRAIRDLGFGLYPSVVNERSPFYIDDCDKSWRQIHAKSPLIHVDKIKAIRKKFGVDFTSVLISAAGAATAKHLEKKGKGGSCKKLNFAFILPLPDHPQTLTNHASAALFPVDVGKADLDIIERLKKCNQDLGIAKTSTFPYWIHYAVKVCTFSVAPIVERLSFVRWISTGFSNLPGSNQPLYWDGQKLLATYFAFGCSAGVPGASFQLLSYHEHMRLVVVIENALMSHEELQEFIGSIVEEIESLYEIATRRSETNGNEDDGLIAKDK